MKESKLIKILSTKYLTWQTSECGTSYVRLVEQPNRKGSQINHATSRGGHGQSYDQNRVFEHVQKPVAAILDRTQVLHSRTTVARPVVRVVVWSHDR